MNLEENKKLKEESNQGRLNWLKSKRETLFGAFGIMVVAITISSALSYLFNLVMNRLIPKADYGDLYSMLTVFLIALTGALSIQTVVTKYIAEFEARKERSNVRLLVRTFSRWLLLVGIIIVIVSSALAWPAAHLFKLKSPFFVVILGASIASTLYLTLPYGIVQGEQKFLALGGANLGNQLSRLLLGILFVKIGLGVYGALGAGFIAAVFVSGFVIWEYRLLFSGEKPSPAGDFEPIRALKFLVPVILAMFFIILLAQIDVLLVKALFSRGRAGDYSYAALAGKAVWFFPEGILMVMFPKVSELKAKGEKTRNVLLMSVGAASVMVGAVAGFYIIFPKFTAWFFAGEKGKSSATVVGLVGLFGITMAIFALVKLIAFYELALEKKYFVLLFLIGGIAEVLGILLFHSTLKSVVLVMFFVALFLLVSNLFLALRDN